VDIWDRFYQSRFGFLKSVFTFKSQKLGGVNENRRVLKYFRHLRPGQQMLDIGVGIGGGARQAARVFILFLK